MVLDARFVVELKVGTDVGATNEAIDVLVLRLLPHSWCDVVLLVEHLDVIGWGRVAVQVSALGRYPVEVSSAWVTDDARSVRVVHIREANFVKKLIVAYDTFRYIGSLFRFCKLAAMNAELVSLFIAREVLNGFGETHDRTFQIIGNQIA